MKTTYVCRVVCTLDVRAMDREDAYEVVQAWADALREGDAEGLKLLQEFQVRRCRPAFDLPDIRELQKPPCEVKGPEPVAILHPRQVGTVT